MNPANSGQALQQLEAFQGSEKAPQDILSGQEQSLGIPAAQQQVSGLRQAITNTTNLLNQVAPGVYGRTANSLVTTAQAGRQIQNESAPIQTKLSGLNTAEGNASNDLNTNLSRAANLASLEQSGQSTKESGLMDIYKALYGQEQDTAAKQADAAKQAEAVREFNVSQANSKSGGSGGLTGAQSLAQTEKAQQQAVVQKITQNLKQVAGRDGYVSPQSYASAASDFVQSGGNLSDFTKYFGYLKNPQNPYYSI